MERYRNLNQACLKWWEQFSRRSYELLALILTKLSSLWRASAFLHATRFVTRTETAHFWMQYTLTFCTHLAPRVTVGCVLWPPGARGLQLFMSASVVTMLFSQHVALCQCWLVSQHGTGIWNCFARKVAAYQLMIVDASCYAESSQWNATEICTKPAWNDESSFHDGLMSFWLWFLPNSAHSDGHRWLCFFLKWRDFFWFMFSFVDVTLMCLCLHIWDETLTSSTFRTVSCELAIPVGVLHYGYPQLSFVHTNRAMVGFWGARQNWPWKSRRVMAMAMTEWSKVFNTAQCHGDP